MTESCAGTTVTWSLWKGTLPAWIYLLDRKYQKKKKTRLHGGNAWKRFPKESEGRVVWNRKDSTREIGKDMGMFSHGWCMYCRSFLLRRNVQDCYRAMFACFRTKEILINLAILLLGMPFLTRKTFSFLRRSEQHQELGKNPNTPCDIPLSWKHEPSPGIVFDVSRNYKHGFFSC